MQKEEILEKSKNVNKNKDPYEMEVQNKGDRLAATAIASIGLFFTIYESYVKDGLSFSSIYFIMISIYLAVYSIYYTSKIDKYRWLYITCACVTTINAIIQLLLLFKVI